MAHSQPDRALYRFLEIERYTGRKVDVVRYPAFSADG
jgi:hypothetical protein